MYTKLPVKSTEKLGLKRNIIDYLKLLPKTEVGRKRKFEDIQLQTVKGTVHANRRTKKERVLVKSTTIVDMFASNVSLHACFPHITQSSPP